LPLIEYNEDLLNDRREMENEFFISLENLARLYEFEPLNIQDKVYPLNIYLSYRYAETILQKIDAGLKLIIVQDKTHAASLVTVKIYDTGTALYYLPVEPLLYFLKNKKRKKAAELLLSVCSYLYQVAFVPYFREKSSYIYYQYEMIEEMVKNNDWDFTKKELREIASTFKELKKQGDRILRILKASSHLDEFEKRLNQFTPNDALETNMLKAASKAFSLYRAYPQRTIFQSINEGLIQSEEEERIRPEQYISFIWNEAGWLYGHLWEYVNAEVQEYGAIDEPMAIQYFDKPQEQSFHDLDFETRMFEVLNELATILNDLS